MYRMLRRDFHAWWQGWIWWLAAIAIIGWVGTCYLRFERRQEERRTANLKHVEQQKSEKLKSEAAYAEATASAAKRRTPDFEIVLAPGGTSEWLDLLKDSPYVKWQYWTSEVSGKYRYYWQGHKGGKGYIDVVDPKKTTSWEESLWRTEKARNIRWENRDTKPITVQLWWVDGVPRRTTNRPDKTTVSQRTNQPRGIGGFLRAQERKTGQTASESARRTSNAGHRGETWSATVVAILAGPELELADDDEQRTIDCGQAVVFINDSERPCIDVNAGDPVVVKYPDNPTGAIKVSVVARPSS